jgi:two-component system response regulator HydG
VLRAVKESARDDRGHRDDGLRHHRERGRGHAPRRLRLHPEALHRAGAAREGRARAVEPPPPRRGHAARERVQGALQVREHRGRSQAIRDVLGRIVKVAPTDATVLITGESGTGKELVAKAIHANSRAPTPVRPGQLRRHQRDAARERALRSRARLVHGRGESARKGLFEEADGGTFFFDEIAETPLTFQAKLLRAIQENEIRRVGENKPIHIDVRIIAATNQDLLPPSPRSASVRTSTTASTSRASCSRRCAIAARTSPSCPSSSSRSTTKDAARARRLGDGVVEALSNTTSPATSASSRTWSSRPSRSPAEAASPSTTSSPTLQPKQRPQGGRTLADVVDVAERASDRAALRECDGSRERAAETSASARPRCGGR